MRPTTLILLIVTILVALALPAAALPAPDDSTLAQWRAALAADGHLRLTTRNDRFEVTRAEMDSVGLRFPVQAKHASFGAFEYNGLPGHGVTWRDVQLIERPHGGHAGVGFVVGALIGGLIGGAIDAAAVQEVHIAEPYASIDPSHSSFGKFVLVGAAIGAGAGTLVSSSARIWLPLAP